jgi:hypothetical protein
VVGRFGVDLDPIPVLLTAGERSRGDEPGDLPALPGVIGRLRGRVDGFDDDGRARESCRIVES